MEYLLAKSTTKTNLTTKSNKEISLGNLNQKKVIC